MSLRSISCLADNDQITGIVQREIGVTGATIVGLAGAFRLASTTAGGTDTRQMFTAGFEIAVRITQRRSGVPSNSPLTPIAAVTVQFPSTPRRPFRFFFCWKDHDGVGRGRSACGKVSPKSRHPAISDFVLAAFGE